MSKIHDWNLTVKEAIALQKTLAEQVIIQHHDGAIKKIAGVDISHARRSDLLFAAVVVMDAQTSEILETAYHFERTNFPYISGLLAFREIPPLLSAFKKLNQYPDVILCDGQGIAHPRGLGLASHLGLWLEIPTIGCAKSRLIGEYEEPLWEKGEESILSYKGRCVGSVLRSKKGVKPLYISPGHMITISQSIEIVKRCLGRFRLAEPIRQAHLAVNRYRIETAIV